MLGSNSLHNRFAEPDVSGSAAILLVDPQEQLRAAMGEAAERITNNLIGLCRVAAAFALPVVVTSRQVLGPIVGSLTALSNVGAAIERPDAEVFGCVPVCDALRELGRRVLFLAHWGQGEDVADAAVAGLQQRFDIRLVADASWPTGDFGESRVMSRLSGAGVETTSWVAVLATLSQDWAHEELSGQARRDIRESLAAYRPTVANYWNDSATRDALNI